MSTVRTVKHSRRGFFQAIGGACTAAACPIAWGEPIDRSRVRATSGNAIEPKWDNRLTVTVGPARADLVGTDHRVLQAAVDYVASLGGGTVQILPGTYRLRNALYLRSKVRIAGSGEDTVLLKKPSGDHEAGGRFRLVRSGDHSRRRQRVPTRRWRLPADPQPAPRRDRRRQTNAGGTKRQLLQARPGPPGQLLASGGNDRLPVSSRW